MRQDFYILEMVKHYFNSKEEIGDDFEKLKLKDLFLTKKEKQAIKESSNLQSKREKGDTSENKLNESYILSKRINFSILDGKIKDSIAIKDIGKNRKLSQDQRVSQLISYLPEKTWSFDEINKELEEYDKIRSFKFFKIIHALEQKIYETAKLNKDESELLHENKPNFKKYIGYCFLKSNEDRAFFNDLKIDKINIYDIANSKLKLLYLIVKIRNKISHNQLISKEEFEFLQKFCPIEDGELSVHFLFRSFKYIIQIVENLVYKN